MALSLVGFLALCDWSKRRGNGPRRDQFRVRDESKKHVRGAQTKIATLIDEAIWRHANKMVEQQAVASKELTTPPSDATMFNNNEATMSPDTKVKLAELSELSIGQLAAKYEKLFGEKCRTRNRRYIYRRVAWKMQADDEGGLSERAILRATVIAGESLLRVTTTQGTRS